MAKIIFKWSDVYCTSSNPSVDLDHVLQSLDTADFLANECENNSGTIVNYSSMSPPSLDFYY